MRRRGRGCATCRPIHAGREAGAIARVPPAPADGGRSACLSRRRGAAPSQALGGPRHGELGERDLHHGRHRGTLRSRGRGDGRVCGGGHQARSPVRPDPRRSAPRPRPSLLLAHPRADGPCPGRRQGARRARGHRGRDDRGLRERDLLPTQGVASVEMATQRRGEGSTRARVHAPRRPLAGPRQVPRLPRAHPCVGWLACDRAADESAVRALRGARQPGSEGDRLRRPRSAVARRIRHAPLRTSRRTSSAFGPT